MVPIADAAGNLSGENVTILDLMLLWRACRDKGAAFTAYALYQNTDYGKDYRLGTTYETGSMVHACRLCNSWKSKTFSTLCFLTNDKSML
jgi:hypothetical protein